MSANDRQHGGRHYQRSEYQHWDWVSDLRLHYLAGCASKYAFRYHDKAGLVDVEKGIHYCDKAEERGVTGSNVHGRYDLFWKFVHLNNVPMRDGAILFYIMEGNWDAAKELLNYVAAELQPAS